mmetsp:Transcript_8591/g.22188  ORF Transcript_8591/g.22188 Transcript_8591/m.22188 type:complete len:260 (-) Transcript_8591:129-908(-)
MPWAAPTRSTSSSAVSLSGIPVVMIIGGLSSKGTTASSSSCPASLVSTPATDSAASSLAIMASMRSSSSSSISSPSATSPSIRSRPFASTSPEPNCDSGGPREALGALEAGQWASSSEAVDCKSTAANAATSASPVPSHVSSPTSSSATSTGSATALVGSGNRAIASAACLQASRTSSPTTPSNMPGKSETLWLSLLACRRRRINLPTSVVVGPSFFLSALTSAGSARMASTIASCSAILCATRRSSTTVSPSMTRSSP